MNAPHRLHRVRPLDRAAGAGIDRRRFLTGGAATVAAITVLGRGVEAAAGDAAPTAADRPPSTGRLVVLFLRGGMDGLSAVVPLLDSTAYRAARPGIAVPDTAALDLDGRFGLHPGLAPLHELHRSGELAVLHAVGNGTDSRSHFAAQAEMELGGVVGAAEGWLTRLLGATRSPIDAPIRAVALSSTTPTSLLGSHSSVATAALAGFGLGGTAGLLAGEAPATALRMLYQGGGDELVAGRALAAVDQLAVLSEGTPAGDGGLDAKLADAAALLRADVGVEVVTVDSGGWDLHNELGTATEGAMRSLLDDLGAALHTFWTALDGGPGAPVDVVVVSEFGRRVAENGSGGVDHGSANALFVLGRSLAGGGRVLADWPGLAADQLDRGDLRATIDHRSVLAELSTRFGVTDVAAAGLFPGFAPQPVGLA
ncbi:MAG: DUF1501 domain-containing protein [Acidimicrobiia bacterium]